MSPIPRGGMRRAAALAMASIMALALLAPLVPPGTVGPRDGPPGPTGAVEDLLVDGEHVVSGDESWSQVTVADGGVLTVPEGAVMFCTDVILQSGSQVLLEGGDLFLFDATLLQFSGKCRHLRISDGSQLVLDGAAGGIEMGSSTGADVEMRVEATGGIWIEDAEIRLLGGDGYSPKQPYGSGSVGRRTSAGGHATLELSVGLQEGYLLIARSTIEVLGGNGGDAPDGRGSTSSGAGLPGGFTTGGSVSDQVARGGDVRVGLSAGLIKLNDTDMVVTAGRGGDAGDGGHTEHGQVQGACGAGYSGGSGADGEGGGAEPGGPVSGQVGRGGDAELEIQAPDISQKGTSITVEAGNGGRGGTGGHSAGNGGGGGAGYSGGGGGSVTDPAGAEGGAVGGEVGSGGDAVASVHAPHTLLLEGSSYTVSAGSGGRAGDGGGSFRTGGGGGGGYSGGGGAGSFTEVSPDQMRGGAGGPVTGGVATGGDAHLTMDSPGMVLLNASLHAGGGNGGRGGIAGHSFQESVTGGYLGGGGGGSYSAGGGGGTLEWPSSHGDGGKGGDVGGNVGDGGNATLLLQCPEPPTIRKDCNVTASKGKKGFCWRSCAEGTTGGRGTGRIPSDGRRMRQVPMSKPILLHPYDGFESPEIPLFRWMQVMGSTTHGGVTGYNFMLDENSDFSSPAYLTTVINGTMKLWELLKGDLYWRARAIYNRPPQNFGPWSDVFKLTHINAPPIVYDIGTVNVTIKVPKSVDLRPFINDTDDEEIDLTLKFTHPAVIWTSGLMITLKYETWVPEHRIYFNVSDKLAKTEGFIPVRVFEYNHDPVILGVGELNPPVLIQLNEGEEFSGKVRAHDSDGDDLTFRLVNPGPTMRLFSNGTLEIVGSPGAIGEYTPTIEVSDGKGGSDHMLVVVRIGDVAEPPERPVFLSPRNGTVVDEGTPITFKIELEDPDFAWGGTVQLTVISNISGILMTTETSRDVEFTVDDLDPGRHQITAIVEDGVFTARSHLDIRVVGEPESPPVWDPPEELLTVLVFVVLSLITLAIGYLIGRRRELRRQRLESMRMYP